MGGHLLRSGALSDPAVVALINRRFVPVWIDVRTTPIPNLPRFDQILIEASLDGERRISNLFSLGFYLRSAVLNPEGDTLLNFQPATLFGSDKHLLETGSFSYAQTKPGEYRAMLQESLERFDFLEENRVTVRAKRHRSGDLAGSER